VSRFATDGKTIAFISNRVGSSEPYDYEVWLTDPAFERLVQLTHLHQVLHEPMFTRDGKHILFTNHDGKSLWQINPDGSGLKQIR
jgi:Tol biopolymer transport system component